MKLVYLSQTSSNKSKIGEFSDRLGTDGLSLYGRNPWATGDLRVNSYSGEGGLISFPFFLVEGNAILPMTPRAGCAVYCSGRNSIKIQESSKEGDSQETLYSTPPE